MIWYLVILVATIVWHLISLKHLLGQAFLTLLLLVKSVGVKACTKLVVSEGASSHLRHIALFLLQNIVIFFFFSCNATITSKLRC